MPRLETFIQKRLRINQFEKQPYSGSGTREDLASLFGDLGYQIGAEIGVMEADYSLVLFKNNRHLKKLYCIDSWKGYVDHKYNIPQERMDRAYQKTLERLNGYPVEIIRKNSVEASKDIPDGSLDFVYIDGGHDFDNVMLDLIHWIPKVRLKGIISGHDYRVARNFQVVEAVEAYRTHHDVQPLYKTGEKHASFLWVKR
jgi:hypothetical protein